MSLKSSRGQWVKETDSMIKKIPCIYVCTLCTTNPTNLLFCHRCQWTGKTEQQMGLMTVGSHHAWHIGEVVAEKQSNYSLAQLLIFGTFRSCQFWSLGQKEVQNYFPFTTHLDNNVPFIGTKPQWSFMELAKNCIVFLTIEWSHEIGLWLKLVSPVKIFLSCQLDQIYSTCCYINVCYKKTWTPCY